ncbi:hypothetical protein Daqu01_02786 [Deinococcus aquaticus]
MFSERLKGVIGQQGGQDVALPGAPDSRPEPTPTEPASLVVTTQDELGAFMIVRVIVASETDVMRVVMRDVQSYCGVLFDDNNRKPVCRLYLNGKRWQVGLFDNEERTETRHDLTSVTELYQEALRVTVKRCLPESQPGTSVVS